MGELEEYIIQNSTGLYSYLLRHTRNHHTAEDLLQETFLKAYLALQDEQPTNMEAWLITIVGWKQIKMKSCNWRFKTLLIGIMPYLEGVI